MTERCGTPAWRPWAAIAVLPVLIGIALAQGQRPARGPRGQVKNQGGVPLKKARPEAADPLAKVAAVPGRPALGTFHYTLRLRAFDGAPSRPRTILQSWARPRRSSCSSTKWAARAKTLKTLFSTSRGRALPSISKGLVTRSSAWTCAGKVKTRVASVMTPSR